MSASASGFSVFGLLSVSFFLFFISDSVCAFSPEKAEDFVTFALCRERARASVLLQKEKKKKTAFAFTRRWWSILSIGAQTVAIDCIMNQRSPVLAYDEILPLEKILPLADITPEPSRMA